MLTEAQGRVLLAAAREAIASGFLGFSPASPSGVDEPALRRVAASFVTLQVENSLHGCMGSLEARRPLVEDVEANARAAAFDDPRFPRLTAADLPNLRIEISVLSPLEPILARDRDELLRVLRPGVDGVMVEGGPKRATFLPQVWSSLSRPVDFVRELLRKAGLPVDATPREVSFQRYTVESWAEDR